MKTQGIRISDKKENIISVELPDILMEISDGNTFSWSILYLYATGCLTEGLSMPAFEETVNKSEKGLLLTWQELNDLAKKFWDVMDITIIGCKNQPSIRRYDDKQRMREANDIVIEMIDSGCWEVFSTDPKLINRLNAKFKETKYLSVSES